MRPTNFTPERSAVELRLARSGTVIQYTLNLSIYADVGRDRRYGGPPARCATETVHRNLRALNVGIVLRVFLFGHVRQLDAAASGWLGNLAPSRAGITRAGALRGPPTARLAPRPQGGLDASVRFATVR